jgi:hypothetical protein
VILSSTQIFLSAAIWPGQHSLRATARSGTYARNVFRTIRVQAGSTIARTTCFDRARSDHQPRPSAGAAFLGDRLGVSGEPFRLSVVTTGRASRRCRRGWWPGCLSSSTCTICPPSRCATAGLRPVLPVLLRGGGVPSRASVRPLVADALTPASGRGAARRPAAGERGGGTQERGAGHQGSGTGGG